MLRVDDPADFIIINNIKEFRVEATYINGQKVAKNGKTLINSVDEEIINNFSTIERSVDDFVLNSDCENIRVIEAEDGELITNEIYTKPIIKDGNIIPDVENDILKLAVVCRYNNEKPSVAFIKNFGLKKGSIASCVAHDSHNIIAVGVTDEDIKDAVNAVIREKGGISTACDGDVNVLPLPVAGIMTNADGYETAENYVKLDMIAKEFGSKLNAPFMTLSFMALLVIPSLKLSDKGLFDGRKFEFTDICK